MISLRWFVCAVGVVAVALAVYLLLSRSRWASRLRVEMPCPSILLALTGSTNLRRYGATSRALVCNAK